MGGTEKRRHGRPRVQECRCIGERRKAEQEERIGRKKGEEGTGSGSGSGNDAMR